MTQQVIFGLLLGNSSSNIENQNHIYPSLIPEAADVVAEKITNILYNSLKTTSSDYRRINILKLLQNLSSVEKDHYSVNDKNCSCVLKHLENDGNKNKSDLDIQLEECQLEVMKHKSKLYEKIIKTQKQSYLKQKEINTMTDYRRNRQRDNLNKLGIVANHPQSRSIYEPNEHNIRQIFGIDERTGSENKNIHGGIDKTTREYRFKQVKFGYAINNVGEQSEVQRHLEIIINGLKKYDQLYDFERLFLQHIFKNIENFPYLNEVLLDNFCRILEMSALRLCIQIISLREVQAVQEFFDDINNLSDFITLKKVCTNDYSIRKIKNILFILYYQSYCNCNVLNLMKKLVN